MVICQDSIDADGDNYGDDYGSESTENCEGDEHKQRLSNLMKELSKYCTGFAIPLQGRLGKLWGVVIIGHKGKHITEVETKVPIHISIGRDVTLQEAVQICVGYSQARIPKPVR